MDLAEFEAEVEAGLGEIFRFFFFFCISKGQQNRGRQMGDEGRGEGEHQEGREEG